MVVGIEGMCRGNGWRGEFIRGGIFWEEIVKYIKKYV